MGYPVLIAMTPRAGRWNHVTLLPPGGLPADLRPADWLGATAGAARRDGYLSVSRVVAQAGSTREGREVLALVSGDVAHGRDVEGLRGWLGQKLIDLGREVEAVDWDAHDGGDFRLSALAAWQVEAVERFGLRPRGPRRTWSRGRKRIAGLAGVIMAAVVLVAIFRPGGPAWGGDGPPGPKKVPPANTGGTPDQAKATREGLRGQFDKLAKDVLDDKATPEERDKLLTDFGKALEGVPGPDGHSWPLPGNYNALSVDEKLTALEGSSRFRAWLKQPANISYGVDEALLGKAKEVGPLGSPGEVYQTLLRAERLRIALVAYLKMGECLHDPDDDQRDVAPLWEWLREYQPRAGSDLDRLRRSIPAVPLLTSQSAGQLDTVARCVKKLSDAVKIELPRPLDTAEDVNLTSGHVPRWFRDECKQVADWKKGNGSYPGAVHTYKACGMKVREAVQQVYRQLAREGDKQFAPAVPQAKPVADPPTTKNRR